MNITAAELNRLTHILKLVIDGKELTFFDTALGNPKDWKSSFEWDERKYDIEYLRSEASHYVKVVSIATDTLRAVQPFEIKVTITDTLPDNLGNINPNPHVYGTPINKNQPKVKYTVDGHTPDGKLYRFTEDPNGEFVVNNIRCKGFPLEIEGEFKTV